MLAQGTVGAYLVSPRANSAAGPLPQPGGRAARGGGRAGVTSARPGGWLLVQRRLPGEPGAGGTGSWSRGRRGLGGLPGGEAAGGWA